VRLVIIGGGGQLGSDLAEALRDTNEDVVSLRRSELDITEASALRVNLSQYDPDVIINCSVYHPVDECENNPERSFAVNATAVRDLALAAKDLRITFSTESLDAPIKKRTPLLPLVCSGFPRSLGSNFCERSCLPTSSSALRGYMVSPVAA